MTGCEEKEPERVRRSQEDKKTDTQEVEGTDILFEKLFLLACLFV